MESLNVTESTDMIKKVKRNVTKGGFDWDGYDYGCHKSWCWSGCYTGFNVFDTYDEWCYTTLTYSQSYSYVRCNNKDDCSNR